MGILCLGLALWEWGRGLVALAIYAPSPRNSTFEPSMVETEAFKPQRGVGWGGRGAHSGPTLNLVGQVERVQWCEPSSPPPPPHRRLGFLSLALWKAREPQPGREPETLNHQRLATRHAKMAVDPLGFKVPGKVFCLEARGLLRSLPGLDGLPWAP